MPLLGDLQNAELDLSVTNALNSRAHCTTILKLWLHCYVKYYHFITLDEIKNLLQPEASAMMTPMVIKYYSYSGKAKLKINLLYT